MGYEDALLNAGFVPKGIAPKRIGANGEPTYQSQGSETLGALNQALAGMFQQFQVAHERKQKDLKDQFDMYKTLRDAGYDPQSAYTAIQKKKFPSTAGGQNLKEQEMQLKQQESQSKIAKNQADVGLAGAKADYYRQGGAKRTVIDKMNPNQLQNRLKWLTDNGDQTDPTVGQEMDLLNKQLQKLSGIDTSVAPATTPQGGATPGTPATTSEEKVVLKRPDGATVRIKASDVPAALQAGYMRV